MSNKIDFSIVLGASMHDMKNSLCMLLQSLETINETVEQTSKAKSEFAKVHYEIARVNSNLLQLLALYREHHQQLPLHIEEHFLDEIFEELISKNALYIENNHIEVALEVDEDLSWYFDSDLVLNLLNDILINALKYTKDKILITAEERNSALVIEIHDNGMGYPENMLNKANEEMDLALLNQGKTGLGLYFAHLIASAHTSNTAQGEIKLNNDGRLGGSQFTLTLP